MNLHRMKKIILILLLAIPVLIEAQNVMTETRQVLTSPDGAMTNTEARTVTVMTDFLEPGKKYTAHLYEDDDKLNTRTKVRTAHKKVKAGDKLILKLKASGGAALHFTPIEK